MWGDFPVSKILRELGNDNLLPAILFRTSRRQCDIDVERLYKNRSSKITADAKEVLSQEVDLIIEKYNLEETAIKQHPHFAPLLETAVGAHHAGQLLIWRLLLEELMSRGLLRIMIATGTVAAGVDFPARTVVITAHSKRGSEGFKVLSSSEFQQMSGRAGRRGKDTVGLCLIAPGPYSDARVIHQVAQRPAEPLKSAYFAAPSTVLNLLKYRNVDDLRYTVSKSLAAFLDRKAAAIIRQGADQLKAELDVDQEMSEDRKKKAQKRIRRKFREAAQLESRQQDLLETSLEGLTILGFVHENGLTEKGSWAAEMCTSLVLELGEAIDSHLLSELSIEELVGVIASISGDHYRPYLSIRQNPIKKEHFLVMQQVIERVSNWYQSSPFASEVAVQPDAAVTVLTWLESEDWTDYAGLLRLGGVAEGDAARLISQTADHLNQISRLSETHPDLSRLAGEGRRLLLRPPITDAYESLVEIKEDFPENQ
jgi:ATP-dependent RNA helicase HelY